VKESEGKGSEGKEREGKENEMKGREGKGREGKGREGKCVYLLYLQYIFVQCGNIILEHAVQCDML
jgi:hypothetical protein